MEKTYVPKSSEITQGWILVDANDQYLGRLATQIAGILLGKNKPKYTPGVDTGDFVVVVNCERIASPGIRWKIRLYYHHSNYPSGIKASPAPAVSQASRPGYPQRRVGDAAA